MASLLANQRMPVKLQSWDWDRPTFRIILSDVISDHLIHRLGQVVYKWDGYQELKTGLDFESLNDFNPDPTFLGINDFTSQY